HRLAFKRRMYQLDVRFRAGKSTETTPIGIRRRQCNPFPPSSMNQISWREDFHQLPPNAETRSSGALSPGSLGSFTSENPLAASSDWTCSSTSAVEATTR